MDYGASKSILAEIDRLVEKNTFSGAGVKAVEALRVKVEEQGKQLVFAQTEMEVKAKRIDILDKELQSAKSVIAGWVAREAALVKREAEITKLEKDAAVAAGQISIVRECFGLVFRNAEIRETISRDTPVVIRGQNGCSDYVQSHQQTTSTTKSQA